MSKMKTKKIHPLVRMYRRLYAGFLLLNLSQGKTLGAAKHAAQQQMDMYLTKSEYSKQNANPVIVALLKIHKKSSKPIAHSAMTSRNRDKRINPKYYAKIRVRAEKLIKSTMTQINARVLKYKNVVQNMSKAQTVQPRLPQTQTVKTVKTPLSQQQQLLQVILRMQQSQNRAA